MSEGPRTPAALPSGVETLLDLESLRRRWTGTPDGSSSGPAGEAAESSSVVGLGLPAPKELLVQLRAQVAERLGPRALPVLILLDACDPALQALETLPGQPALDRTLGPRLNEIHALLNEAEDILDALLFFDASASREARAWMPRDGTPGGRGGPP